MLTKSTEYMGLSCRIKHLPYSHSIGNFSTIQCCWETIIQRNNSIIKLAVKATILFTFPKAGMLPMELGIYEKGKHSQGSCMVDKPGFTESHFISMLLEFWNNVVNYLGKFPPPTISVWYFVLHKPC